MRVADGNNTLDFHLVCVAKSGFGLERTIYGGRGDCVGAFCGGDLEC